MSCIVYNAVCKQVYLSHDDVIDQSQHPGGISCTNPAVRAGNVTSTHNTSIWLYKLAMQTTPTEMIPTGKPNRTLCTSECRRQW